MEDDDDILKSATLRRELGSPRCSGPQRSRRQRLGFSDTTAQKLSVEAILTGHRGCVNRLAWNETGTLLASGSDDRQVLIWRYPDTQHPPMIIDTQHQANIFGVKFLPASGDKRLVSGAMDYTVQLHTLDRCPLTGPPEVYWAGPMGYVRPPRSHRRPNAATVVFNCHRGRVKGVEVEPGNPHLFWSASEDGTVRQFDTRLSTATQRDYSSDNVLLVLPSKAPGRHLEVKSIALNKVAPHQLAVGAGDQYVRLYDRRMMGLGPPRGSGAVRAGPVLKLAPPHLCLGQATPRAPSRMHTTCVAFGNRGDKVVATYHNDHVYVFDVTGSSSRDPAARRSPPASPPSAQQPAVGAAGTAGAAATWSPAAPPLPAQASDPDLDFFRPGTEAAKGLPGDRLRLLQGAPGGGGIAGTANGMADGAEGGGPPMLPAAAEAAKAEGNLHYFNKQYPASIQQYSRAIQLAPWAAVLYTNRALALLHRGWEGDAMAALRDCEAALELDPAAMKAHFRLVQALLACKLLKSAEAAARIFRRQFPEDAGEELAGVEDQVAAQLAQRAQRDEMRRQQRESRRQARRRQGLNLERRDNPQPAAPSIQAATALRPSPGTEAAAAAGPARMDNEPPSPAGRAGRPARAAGTAGSPGSPSASSVATSDLAASSPSSSGGASPSSADAAWPARAAGPAAAAAALASAAGRPEPSATQPAARDPSSAPPTPQAGTAGAPHAASFATVHAQAGAAAAPPPGAAQGGDGGNGGGWGGQEEPAAVAAVAAVGTPASPSAHPGQPASPGRGAGPGEGADRTPGAAGGGPHAAEAPLRARRGADSDSDTDWVDLWGGHNSSEEEGDDLGQPDVDQQFAEALERAYQASSEKHHPSGSNGFIGPHRAPPPSLPQPSLWGAFEGGSRLLQRYVGQCNVQTDIKEATFLGPHDELVACGSDDGHVFIFNAASGECIRVLKADDDVANCVQCHPHLPVLATSGIDHAIKVWSPEGPPTSGGNLEEMISLTQERMREGPTVLRGVDPRLLAALSDNPALLRALLQRATGLGGDRAVAAPEEGAGEVEDDEEGQSPGVTCRVG